MSTTMSLFAGNPAKTDPTFDDLNSNTLRVKDTQSSDNPENKVMVIDKEGLVSTTTLIDQSTLKDPVLDTITVADTVKFTGLYNTESEEPNRVVMVSPDGTLKSTDIVAVYDNQLQVKSHATPVAMTFNAEQLTDNLSIVLPDAEVATVPTYDGTNMLLVEPNRRTTGVSARTVSIGSGAGIAGNDNTVMGYNALKNNAAGSSSSVVLGSNAGKSVSAVNSVLIGNAGTSATASSLTNSIVLGNCTGAAATATNAVLINTDNSAANNTISIGNASTTTVVVKGIPTVASSSGTPVAIVDASTGQVSKATNLTGLTGLGVSGSTTLAATTITGSTSITGNIAISGNNTLSGTTYLNNSNVRLGSVPEDTGTDVSFITRRNATNTGQLHWTQEPKIKKATITTLDAATSSIGTATATSVGTGALTSTTSSLGTATATSLTATSLTASSMNSSALYAQTYATGATLKNVVVDTDGSFKVSDLSDLPDDLTGTTINITGTSKFPNAYTNSVVSGYRPVMVVADGTLGSTTSIAGLSSVNSSALTGTTVNATTLNATTSNLLGATNVSGTLTATGSVVLNNASIKAALLPNDPTVSNTMTAMTVDATGALQKTTEPKYAVVSAGAFNGGAYTGTNATMTGTVSANSLSVASASLSGGLTANSVNTVSLNPSGTSTFSGATVFNNASNKMTALSSDGTATNTMTLITKATDGTLCTTTAPKVATLNATTANTTTVNATTANVSGTMTAGTVAPTTLTVSGVSTFNGNIVASALSTDSTATNTMTLLTRYTGNNVSLTTAPKLASIASTSATIGTGTITTLSATNATTSGTLTVNGTAKITSLDPDSTATNSMYLMTIDPTTKTLLCSQAPKVATINANTVSASTSITAPTITASGTLSATTVNATGTTTSGTVKVSGLSGTAGRVVVLATDGTLQAASTYAPNGNTDTTFSVMNTTDNSKVFKVNCGNLSASSTSTLTPLNSAQTQTANLFTGTTSLVGTNNGTVQFPTTTTVDTTIAGRTGKSTSYPSADWPLVNTQTSTAVGLGAGNSLNYSGHPDLAPARALSTYIGYNSGYNDSDSNNTIVGANAMNRLGYWNSATKTKSSGNSKNTVVGANSFNKTAHVSSGNTRNTLIGDSLLNEDSAIPTATSVFTDNIVLATRGASSLSAPSTALTNYTNGIFIGTDSETMDANKTAIGNTSTTKTKLYGVYSNEQTSPTMSVIPYDADGNGFIDAGETYSRVSDKVMIVDSNNELKCIPAYKLITQTVTNYFGTNGLGAGETAGIAIGTGVLGGIIGGVAGSLFGGVFRIGSGNGGGSTGDPSDAGKKQESDLNCKDTFDRSASSFSKVVAVEPNGDFASYSNSNFIDKFGLDFCVHNYRSIDPILTTIYYPNYMLRGSNNGGVTTAKYNVMLTNDNHITSGNNNAALGWGALSAVSSGTYNVGMGTDLCTVSNGDGQTLVGRNMFTTNVVGHSNVIGVGANINQVGAGNALTSCTYLGSSITPTTAATTNEIVLGGLTTTGAGSNSMILGNSSLTKAFLHGVRSAADTNFLLYNTGTKEVVRQTFGQVLIEANLPSSYTNLTVTNFKNTGAYATADVYGAAVRVMTVAADGATKSLAFNNILVPANLPNAYDALTITTLNSTTIISPTVRTTGAFANGVYGAAQKPVVVDVDGNLRSLAWTDVLTAAHLPNNYGALTVDTMTAPNIVSTGTFTAGGAYGALQRPVVVDAAGAMRSLAWSNILVPANLPNSYANLNVDALTIGGTALNSIIDARIPSSSGGTLSLLGASNLLIGGIAIGSYIDNRNHVQTRNTGTMVCNNTKSTSSITGNYNTVYGTDSALALTSGQYNTLLGFKAGNALVNGNSHVAIGTDALTTMTGNTDGCVAVGFRALRYCTASASMNTAVGTAALTALTSGIWNTAIGGNAMLAATNSTRNVAIGSSAGGSIISGSDGNVMIGHGAMSTTTLSDNNVVIGNQVGNGSRTGNISNCIIIGSAGATGVSSTEENVLFSGFVSGTGMSDTISIGNNSHKTAAKTYIQGIYGATVSSPQYATVGSDGRLGSSALTTDSVFALLNLTDPTKKLTFDLSALSTGTTCAVIVPNSAGGLLPSYASNQVVLGISGSTTGASVHGILSNAVSTQPSTSRAVVVDENGKLGAADSLVLFQSAGGVSPYGFPNRTSGHNNCGFGRDTIGSAITSGSYNFAFGNTSFNYLTTGQGNIGIGYGVGRWATSAGWNIGIGSGSLFSLTTANNNIAIGRDALFTLEDGGANDGQNIAIGTKALEGLTTGEGNVVAGYNGGKVMTTGSDNVILGTQTATAMTSGSGNVVIGAYAGTLATTGVHNICIGKASDIIGTAGYSIVIGENCYASTDYTIVIGSDNYTGGVYLRQIYGQTKVSGTHLAVYTTPDGKLFTNTSTRATKKSIAPIDHDYVDAFIESQVPVSFQYKDDKDTDPVQFGLIADDLEAAGFDALCAYKADGSLCNIQSQFIPFLLMNKVKRQAKKLKEHEARINKLEQMLQKLLEASNL